MLLILLYNEAAEFHWYSCHA